MAKVVITPVSGSGVSSGWIVLNPQVTPMNTTLAVAASGTVTYTCAYTLDDPNNTVNPSSAVPPLSWPIATLTSQTASVAFNLVQPVMAVNCTINSGTGTVVFYVLQAGLRQS